MKTNNPIAPGILMLLLAACAIRPAGAAAPAAEATGMPVADVAVPLLAQHLDAPARNGLVVRVDQPGFNPAGISSVAFRAYARVAPGLIKDGNGIARVIFKVRGPNWLEYEQIQYHAPFCLFREAGGDACLALDVGDRWYGTKQRIGPGAYTLLVEIEGVDGNRWRSSLDFKLK